MNETLSRAAFFADMGYEIEIDGDNGTVMAYNPDSEDYVCLAQF